MEVVLLNVTTAFYAIEGEPAFTVPSQWGMGGIDVVEIASLSTGSCCPPGGSICSHSPCSPPFPTV